MDSDLIVERSYESALRRWKANTHPNDVIRLAAKYRPEQPKCIVESVLDGSFNVCFKVAFIDDIRWIVRVPKPGRVMFLEKYVRDTVAAMKKVQLSTSIPVPNIIAFGMAEENIAGFGPFIITEFVLGDNLGDKLYSNPDKNFEQSIYRQIAGFLLELSDCRFDSIGSLSMDDHRDQPSWSVESMPLTLAINETLRCGGVNLYSRVKPPYESVSKYFLAIAEQKWEHLIQQRNSMIDYQDAIKKLERRRFFKSITPRFVTKKWNDGPFTLVCEDLHPGNMIVQGEKIVAVLGWDWTYAGPLELLMVPPRWLCNGGPAVWNTPEWTGYDTKLRDFVGILQEEELRIGKPTVMSQLMEEFCYRTGNFAYHQLLSDVSLFDDDTLWNQLEVEYAGKVKHVPYDQSLIDRAIEGKLEHHLKYEAMVGTMRILEHLVGSQDSTGCSFCWACLLPGWRSHDISECFEVPYEGSTVSVVEAAEACRSQFSYPPDLELHHRCGAPSYLCSSDTNCPYQGVAYAVYIAATGKARRLHLNARKIFSNHYNIDLDTISQEELTKVIVRPYLEPSRTISALLWFLELIHDNTEASFQWYFSLRPVVLGVV